MGVKILSYLLLGIAECRCEIHPAHWVPPWWWKQRRNPMSEMLLIYSIFKQTWSAGNIINFFISIKIFLPEESSKYFCCIKMSSQKYLIHQKFSIKVEGLRLLWHPCQQIRQQIKTHWGKRWLLPPLSLNGIQQP